MGSRLARASLAVFAAVAVMTVPAISSANTTDDPGKHAAASGKPSPAPTTSPQPTSGADDNKGGANNDADCGAYCSTRDGNGSGNGKNSASPQPCAGCEGKADNKYPPGQNRDGDDDNNGYECDGNEGVAKTNPAHTGCMSPTTAPTSSPSCVPTPTDPCESPSPCVPTPTDPCETPSPCVPTPTDPCESPTATPTVNPTVSPTVNPTVNPTVSPSGAVGTPSVSPSVRGVKTVRPRANPPGGLGGRLPTTGNTAPIGILLAIGFALTMAGVGITVSTPAHHHH